MPANLNRKQQREIKAVVERAKKDNGIPQTAQQSIPFQRMFPDGICRVTDSYYTKTIQFQDINYQLAQQEDKTAIFDEWCSFLNFFDSSIHFELSFMNLSTDAESFEKSIRIPFKKDSFNPVRAEYSQMLKKQLAQGNNGLTKTKYLTFGIEAESMRQAKPRLNHIENDLLNNFRRLGVIATTMNGKERLHLMHSMFHMGDNDKFFFDWKYLVESGLSVKDFIGRKVISALFIFVMIFTAPLIPTYLNVKNLGLLDSMWALILPGAISVYNMIIARTYFQNSIPGEMLESARLDGCDDIRVLVNMVLPLSKSILAVLVLYYAIAHWNSYFDAFIYLSSENKFTLQVVLRNIMNSVAALEEMATTAEQSMRAANIEVLKYAIIVFGSIPLIILYPFVQKHFVKGVMIGSVKG